MLEGEADGAAAGDVESEDSGVVAAGDGLVEVSEEVSGDAVAVLSEDPPAGGEEAPASPERASAGADSTDAGAPGLS